MSDAASVIDTAYDCLDSRLASTPEITEGMDLGPVRRFNEQKRNWLKQLAAGEITEREFDVRLEVAAAILAASLRLKDDPPEDDRIVL